MTWFFGRGTAAYGAWSVFLGLAGLGALFGVTRAASVSWATWAAGYGGIWENVVPAAIAVAVAVVIAGSLPRIALAISLVTALWYMCLTAGMFLFFGGIGLLFLPAFIATTLVGAALRRDSRVILSEPSSPN